MVTHGQWGQLLSIQILIKDTMAMSPLNLAITVRDASVFQMRRKRVAIRQEESSINMKTAHINSDMRLCMNILV